MHDLPQTSPLHGLKHDATPLYLRSAGTGGRRIWKAEEGSRKGLDPVALLFKGGENPFDKVEAKRYFLGLFQNIQKANENTNREDHMLRLFLYLETQSQAGPACLCAFSCFTPSFNPFGAPFNHPSYNR